MHNSRLTATKIPIVEEQAQVDRQVDETGALRVRIKAEVDHQRIDTPVRSLAYRIERVQRDAPVDVRRAPWHEGSVIVVPVYEEVIVKQLVLKEEVRLVPTHDVTQETHDVALVRERPIFERRDAQGQWHEVSI